MTKETPRASKTTATSDTDIVAAVLEGDQERYGELVKRYQGRLANYLLRLVRDYGEAHDLAQDVFLKAYLALDRYDPKYKFSTWLFRVAQNAAIDQIRKRRLAVVSMDRPGKGGGEDKVWEFPSGEKTPYGDFRNTERGQAIQKSIDALPWEYRELIVMRHYGELSYEQIATLKEMPLGTVKNKLFRGRQMLKEKLADFLTD